MYTLQIRISCKNIIEKVEKKLQNTNIKKLFKLKGGYIVRNKC